MTQTILFYTDTLTPRLRYTVASIVGNLLGLNLVFTQDKDPFVTANMPKINYSSSRLSPNEVFIESQELLFEKTFKTYNIKKSDDFFINKNAANTADVDFDIFARIFFLVSRYEEYNVDPSVLDAYGRFSSTKSVASKLDFLQQPLVNQYVMLLSEKLKNRFPNLDMSFPAYRFQPTFDIDNAWLYRNKGFLRQTGGFLKDILSGQLAKAKNRFDILRGTTDDPYFNFAYIQKLHQEYGLSPVVFWLLGNLGKYDKNIVWQNTELQTLVQTFAKQYKIGIHPSYRSNDAVSILKKRSTAFG